MKSFCTLSALCGLLVVPATAGDVVTPDGFNVETDPARGPLYAVLPDGSVLRSTGAFGAEQLKRVSPDGASQIFAEGVVSLAGLAISDVSGDILVGDSADASALKLLRDLNDDGDVLDPGENVPYPVQPPLMPDGFAPSPFDVAFAPGTETLYMTVSTFGSPSFGAVLRLEDGEWSIFGDGLTFPGGIAFDGDALLVTDSAFPDPARVVRFVDLDGDGDALDPGEQNDYAIGLTGGNAIVLASDGSAYVSGTYGGPLFLGCVDRLLPDADDDGAADGVQPCYFGEFPDIGPGFSFTSGLLLIEGDGGFVPGVSGDGRLLVTEFSFAGDYIIRSAPLASTEVVGVVGPDQNVDVIVGGAPFADGVLILSLDPTCTTVPGIGDLGLGFGAAFAISPLLALGSEGEARLTLTFRGSPELIGQPLVFQGVTLQDGEYGLGDALDFVFGE